MSYSFAHDLKFTSTTFDENNLGFERDFRVLDFVTDSLHPPFKNAAQCHAIFCVNKSGGTLAKGAYVEASDTAAYPFPLAVDVVAGADEVGVGFVSPWIDGDTVANGAAFWLITKGLTRVVYASGTILVGSPIEAAASGRVALYDDGQLLGFSQEAKSSGAGELFWAYVDQRGL